MEQRPFIHQFMDARLLPQEAGIHPTTAGVSMPIPLHLNDQDLTFECPRCRSPITRKGSWFKVVASFNCPACKAALRLGYPEKLRLFARYQRRAEKPLNQ